jgi:RimJ/RimL family protein N-acetyltransferase
MSDSRISLRPLSSADLLLITPWFEDAETSRFLGGPGWPAQMFALAWRSAGTMFRGARRIDSHQYLALADGASVGYIDCGTFDRCTVYGGEGPYGPIIVETIDAVKGAIAFVITAELRRRGLGRAMIAAMVARREFCDVELFEAGVEPQNTASRRCLGGSGFELSSERPDFEGMLYYRVRRRDLIERGTRSA